MRTMIERQLSAGAFGPRWPSTRGPWLRALLLLAVCAAVASVATAARADTPPEIFRTSDRCIACHNNLTTPQGEDVSIGYDWRSSMMANAARDPYWQASVRRETRDNPSIQGAIEDKCSICHMGMSRTTQKAAGGMGQVFANLPGGKANTPQAVAAADGVSCSLCHQIQPSNFGQEQSFTGGFLIDTARPMGQRQIFGSFAVDSGRRRIMQSSTQFVPTKVSHTKQSELCATCHTLYTHARDPQGREVGKLPEQVPYLEWLHSSYRATKSCQTCHMPVVPPSTSVTSVLPKPRSNVSRHAFRGGNFFMPRLLNRYRAQLGVVARPQELNATARRTVEHLRTAAAKVSVHRASVSNGLLDLEITVKNLAGHKLPTAYPSRRVWLHLTVHDQAGKLLFESGRLTKRGLIVGNDNDVSPDRYEPHHLLIQRSDQVQIYEVIMVDSGKRVTTGLLRGVRYIKDNRVLPAGFDKATAKPDIAVHGRAAHDTRFVAGADRVRYRVSLRGARGVVRVRAELWYQPIGFRWAENLLSHNTSETNRFVTYYRSLADGSGMMLASAEKRVVLPRKR